MFNIDIRIRNRIVQGHADRTFKDLDSDSDSDSDIDSDSDSAELILKAHVSGGPSQM